MCRGIKQTGLNHRYHALCTDDLVLCCPSVIIYFILKHKFQVFVLKEPKIAIILRTVFLFIRSIFSVFNYEVVKRTPVFV
jgi:hypothetical protein